MILIPIIMFLGATYVIFNEPAPVKKTTEELVKEGHSGLRK